MNINVQHHYIFTTLGLFIKTVKYTVMCCIIITISITNYLYNDGGISYHYKNMFIVSYTSYLCCSSPLKFSVMGMDKWLGKALCFVLKGNNLFCKQVACLSTIITFSWPFWSLWISRLHFSMCLCIELNHDLNL